MHGTSIKIKSANSVQSVLFGVTLNLFESHPMFTENLSKIHLCYPLIFLQFSMWTFPKRFFFSRNSVHIPSLHHLKQYGLSIITSKISLP